MPPEEIKELGADKPAPEYTDMPNAYVAPDAVKKKPTRAMNRHGSRCGAAVDLDD